MIASASRAHASSFRVVSTGLFLVAAAASFVLSVTLGFTGSEQQGIFVGLWVPSILALGALLNSAEARR